LCSAVVYGGKIWKEGLCIVEGGGDNILAMAK
jgi:hypothetical protein